ncbi:hypothetical protein TrST_g12314 [Triparma strigata]|uniref:PPPDE domain-containing protein n=1 Tax=Triparma strigata TaxID=1606541 RepID=A0A9W7B1L7_9STRA|nr:hypothetical protein TrST_g12314 [Triparma strigata]
MSPPPLTPVSREPETNHILLHVYDLPNSSVGLLNSIFYTLSIGGLYHTGLEVNGIEYSYGSSQSGTGIFACRPKERGEGFRCTVDFGNVRTTVMSSKRTLLKVPFKGDGEEIGKYDNSFLDGNELVLRLAEEWLGTEYSLLHKNCVSFCRELAYKLGIDEEAFPNWVYSFTEAADGLFGIHSFPDPKTSASEADSVPSEKGGAGDPSPAPSEKDGGVKSPVMTDCEIHMLNEAAARMCMTDGSDGGGVGIEDEIQGTISKLDQRIQDFNAFSRSFDRTTSSMTVLHSSMTSGSESSAVNPPQHLAMQHSNMTISEMGESDGEELTKQHKRHESIGTVEYYDYQETWKMNDSFSEAGSVEVTTQGSF